MAKKSSPQDIQDAINEFYDYICAETLAVIITNKPLENPLAKSDIEIDGCPMTISLERVDR
ncbi:hypothetical protein KAR91_52880 [Candidatus Pacearchaeota archaeon]|nr:hypothetical protein [Candidatus Pacearchaeota archaeon]